MYKRLSEMIILKEAEEKFDAAYHGPGALATNSMHVLVLLFSVCVSNSQGLCGGA